MSSNFGSISFNGELDNYTVSLVAGRTYYLEVVGDNGNGTPLPDSILALYRSGVVVASDDDGGAGFNSRLVFTATQTGNYSVEVGGFAGFNTGDYHLLVNEDDYRGTVDGDGFNFSIEGSGAVGAVNTGGTGAGTTNYDGDADLFSSNLISGLNYTIEMLGSATGDGSLDDPYLYLLDSGGNYITENDDGGIGLNSSITYQAQANGTHYFEAHSFANFDTGDYTIRVSAGLGSAIADSIVGLASADAVNAAGGNDTVLGGGGNDLLVGASGNDLIRGQAGNDVLRGGAGLDILSGGAGNDRFDFDLPNESSPAIRDIIRTGDGASAFQGVGNAAGDRIDLSTIDANTGAGGNQAFHLGGAFVGRLTFSNVGANTLVQGNTDGDAAIELAILIEDGASASAANYRILDFIL